MPTKRAKIESAFLEIASYYKLSSSLSTPACFSSILPAYPGNNGITITTLKSYFFSNAFLIRAARISDILF
jgi:hypothetical protein